jgi:hypothetical protein
MTTNDMPKIVGVEYLATILQKSVTTIKLDANRKPESLPPRWKPPGCHKHLWLESDVIEWVRSYGAQQAKKRGRPSGVGA